jgi:hypothetical protein
MKTRLSEDRAVVYFQDPRFDSLRFNRLMYEGKFLAAAEMTIDLDDTAASDLFRLAVDKAIERQSAKELSLITSDIRLKKQLHHDQIQQITNIIVLAPVNQRIAC